MVAILDPLDRLASGWDAPEALAGGAGVEGVVALGVHVERRSPQVWARRGCRRRHELRHRGGDLELAGRDDFPGPPVQDQLLHRVGTAFAVEPAADLGRRKIDLLVAGGLGLPSAIAFLLLGVQNLSQVLPAPASPPHYTILYRHPQWISWN